MLGTKSLASWY